MKPSATWALALLPALVACSSADAPNLDIPEYHALRDVAGAPPALRKAAEAVVRIETATHSGTGLFVTGGGQLLTNNHVLGAGSCAREGCFVTLTLRHERSASGSEEQLEVFVRPFRIHPELDLALLEVVSAADRKPVIPPAFLTFAPLTSAELVGKRVHVIGHPNGRLKKWSTGQVVGRTGNWLSTTAFSLPGSSGSPFLDDEGRVVGILHRGSTGSDLVSSSGINDESVGSAAADVMRVLEDSAPGADGLDLLRSVDAPATEAEIIADQAVWLLARRPEATVDGVKRRVLDLLATACDAALAAPRRATVEAFEEAITPCDAAASWIACRDAEGQAHLSCPRDAEAWRTRFRRVADAYAPYSTTAMLYYRARAVGALEATPEGAERVARDALVRYVASPSVTLDLPVASYLAYGNVATFGSVRVGDYLQNYAKIPHYELDATWIVSGLVWASARRQIDRAQAEKAIRSLLADTRLSIGAWLYVEDVAFNSKFVQ